MTYFSFCQPEVQPVFAKLELRYHRSTLDKLLTVGFGRQLIVGTTLNAVCKLVFDEDRN